MTGTLAGICRLCGAELKQVFADLGSSPLANSYLEPDELDRPEPVYPLLALVCGTCFLVQLPAVVSAESIFGEYAYFSSYSESWLEHARRYVETVAERLRLGPGSFVVEVASNDGYLLQFVQPLGIGVLGIEPARNVAAVARQRGIPTVEEFLGPEVGERVAREHGRADLVVANNVLAHTPDLHGFTSGLRALVADDGVLTLEFHHLLQLIERREFDTIYHEHFSYLSLGPVERLFAEHGLELFDVEELPTHGGSVRIYAAPVEAGGERSPRLGELREREEAAGLHRLETYAAFAEAVGKTKRGLLRFLEDVRAAGETVVAYGAAAKGSTLLNYCGIDTRLVQYVADRSPHKQGRYLPGSRLPIHAPEHVAETRPDYLLLLAWNLRDEIVDQMGWIREWGGRFVVPVPEVAVIA